MRKAFNILSTVLVVIAILLALLLAGTKLIGLQPYVVLSPSMEPTFATGSVVYVRKTAPEEIEVGDVITFQLDEQTLATHRVVSISGSGSGLSFKTKGDANNLPDSSPVKAANVVGKVLFSVPKLGAVMEYIHTANGRTVAIACGVLLILLVALPDVIFRRKEKKPEEDKTGELPDGFVKPDEEIAQNLRKEET